MGGGGAELSKLIKAEINPFLSIPIEKKMKTSSIEDYAQKLIDFADGYILIDEENLICGIVAAYIRNRYDEKKIYLSLLGISRNIRGNGFGKKLLSKIIEDIPKNCMLFTNVDAENKIAFKCYQKAGFKLDFVENGRKTIYLIKN